MRKFILITLTVIGLNACTKDFEETNTDPNKLTEITAGSVLNPVLYELAKRNAYTVRNLSAPMMQMFIQTDDYINAPFLYSFTQNVGGSMWNAYYKQINNLNEMEQAAIREGLPNYEAIALSLKAYTYSLLTDTFGDVPMVEAGQAENGVFYPSFTPQKEIYEQIFKDLSYANSLYDPESPMPYVPDILFNNDVLHWQKFTNSLHLRLLLRVSNRPELQAFEKLKQMLNDPMQYPVFESNEEHAVIEITGIPPLLSPWDRPQDFGVFRYYTAFFIDRLNEWDDPRRAVFASEAKGLNNENYGYIGEPIDYLNESLADSIATASGVQNSLAEAPLIIPILTFAEVSFIKAELAQRGYLGQAEMHYKTGVEAAVKLWGEDLPSDYFDNPLAAYDNSLSRILTQKYFGLFFTDLQAWYEHRRTGLPVLPTTTAMENNQQMPERLYYPIDEVDRNYDNYLKAIDQMGPDQINTKVWWNK